MSLYQTGVTSRCHACEREGREDRATRLIVCPVCHRKVCSEHAFSLSGKKFCTRGCAELFYFGDPDEPPDFD